jgi:predicted peptidase
MQMTGELISVLAKQYPIDRSRIYVMGFSMGASGVWDLITRQPGTFAAAVAVSGYTEPWKARRLRRMPIWVFHGAWDTWVPVSESRQMVAAMR